MGNPQDSDWGGLTWTPWRALNEVVMAQELPMTGGLYRFRARGEAGLLYIGESTDRRRRLTTLAKYRTAHPALYYLEWPEGEKRPHRGHYCAPYLRQCEDAGATVEVSTAHEVHAERVDRRAVETDLIERYLKHMGIDPPCQHGGKGVAAYVRNRTDMSSAGE